MNYQKMYVVQRVKYTIAFTCSPSPSKGTQAMIAWQEDSASKPLKGRIACEVMRIEQLSSWRLNHFEEEKAIQAVCSCSIDRLFHSVQHA